MPTNNNEIRVDTDKMKNSGPEILNIKGRAQSLYGNLTGKLAEAGNAWGDDEAGNQWYSSYSGPKDELLHGIQGSADALGSMHDGVMTMAQGFEGTEEQNRDSINTGSDDGYGSDSGYGSESDDGDSGRHGSGSAGSDR